MRTRKEIDLLDRKKMIIDVLNFENHFGTIN